MNIHIFNILILIFGYLLIRFVICKDDFKESSPSMYGPTIDLGGCLGYTVMLIWTFIFLIVFYVFDLNLL